MRERGVSVSTRYVRMCAGREKKREWERGRRERQTKRKRERVREEGRRGDEQDRIETRTKKKDT